MAGMVSPSCTTCPAGYACYATRIESFQRIGYRASDDSWALWEKDGTRIGFAPVHRASTPGQTCTPNTVSGSSGAWSGWSGYYVTDLTGGKIDQPGRQAQITRLLLDVLEPPAIVSDVPP